MLGLNAFPTAQIASWVELLLAIGSSVWPLRSGTSVNDERLKAMSELCKESNRELPCIQVECLGRRPRISAGMEAEAWAILNSIANGTVPRLHRNFHASPMFRARPANRPQRRWMCRLFPELLMLGN